MQKFNFNNGWLFSKEGGQQRILDLPHDAMIEEQRKSDSPGGSGGAYFPGGVYTYEKRFFVPDDWKEKYAAFQFEGVYRNAKVFINGIDAAGGRPYGYIPFFVEPEGLLNYGSENIIRVAVDNSSLPNTRWYSGSGIHRPVWLWLGSKSHINIEGIKISTLSYAPARIKVEVSHTGGDTAVEILYKGEKITSGEGDNLTLEIPSAKLWSDETPDLYQCRVTISENGVLVDEAAEIFGIRLVEWSTKGLFINGRETLLRGGCVHHDNGILGARSYAESEDRRARILKKTGFNAIRSAHNPASPALLEACDRYGLYVMDETWDMWFQSKTKYDYATDFEIQYEYDLNAMIRRDYNHPSVIMYSIGNEVSEPHTEKGLALAKTLTELAHTLDSTRPVTCGINLTILYATAQGRAMTETAEMFTPTDSASFNKMTAMFGERMNQATAAPEVDKTASPVLDILDFAGYNYASARYPLEGEAHPDRVIVGSETFPFDIAKNWAMVKRCPYLIGDFMWTAWDYLGEAGLGTWAYTKDGCTFDKPYPWLLADTGAIDILGNVEAEAEYAAVVWGLRQMPYIGVQPVNHPHDEVYKAIWRGTNAIASWAWKDCEGNRAFVEVYANTATVMLLLNGEVVGTAKVEDCRAAFELPYTPGTLTAIAYNEQGVEISRSSLVSAEGPVKISVIPEKDTVHSGEVVYVNISLIGENGIVESNADTKLTVTVEGGELLAFGSANPRTEESYNDGAFTTYYGRAQAVIRSKEPGIVSVSVTGKNFEPVQGHIKVTK